MCVEKPKTNESQVLIEIEHFIQFIYSNKFNEIELKKKLIELVSKFKEIYKLDLVYSESVKVFIAMVKTLDELLITKKTIHDLNVFESRVLWNDALYYFKDVDLELLYFKSQESENQESLKTYIKSLIQHYSKLLFVRVDLSIEKKYQHEIGIEQFNQYLRTFLNRVQNHDTCFKDLQGYAWAIEQGEKKGYHCHVLLIYDGHKHQKDYGMAIQVGQCWAKITDSKGYFFNSNTPAYKEKFNQKGILGIGMIYRNKPEQVQNAINAAMYLVNPEKDNQHLRVKVKKMRSFGKGQYEVAKRRGCVATTPPPAVQGFKLCTDYDD